MIYWSPTDLALVAQNRKLSGSMSKECTPFTRETSRSCSSRTVHHHKAATLWWWAGPIGQGRRKQRQYISVDARSDADSPPDNCGRRAGRISGASLLTSSRLAHTIEIMVAQDHPFVHVRQCLIALRASRAVPGLHLRIVDPLRILQNMSTERRVCKWRNANSIIWHSA